MNELIFNNATLPIVCGCDVRVAPEPFFHADRMLDFHVMIYVVQGCIYVTEEGIDYEVNAGELLFLKSGLRHFGKREIPKGTKWYFVHFYMKESEVLPEFAPDERPLLQYERLAYSMRLSKKLCQLAGSKTERLIMKLTEQVNSQNMLKRWQSNMGFFKVLNSIAFQEKPPQTLSDRLAEFLAAGYEKPFSARELEEHFFLSYKHMAAMFKKEKGQTLQQYHTQIRMEYACRLLKTTLLPIGEIARRLGYSDMLYFSRCFRQSMGVSPREYRKTWKETY